ncbi:DUF4832 domain-containing protein [Photobacterium sp. NCIMB 13483]|uniref:DUF4832 domain-containing protein n=1 Tax=Photobacterium sp. NCIMB 13483 TaxID=2022103 RepID=UPI000D178888|nr:DUF4832 domain-containing protein [Photobacterium sp. NCIMB 13483]PST93243.1 DUF4832 domain-containing protein [Photobacterium sp. NCIMB 13483]
MTIVNKHHISLCFFSLFLPSFVQAMTITYQPTVSHEILVNPDIGITDHQTIDIRDNPNWNIPSYPKTSVVYFRWYWEQLEPQRGKYNYKLIDDTIQAAKKENKKIVIRFMTLAGLNETYYSNSSQKGKKILGIPCWLKKQLDPQTHHICTNNNSFIVNYNNPIFKQKLQQFITAMGKRYDHNPDILRLDVGLVGTWGEWHLATHYAGKRPTLGHIGYTTSELTPYIEMMRKAFPNKMLSIDLGSPDDDFASYATKHGLGWRADCLGDWAKGWNHMQDGYPQTLRHIEGKTSTNNRTTEKFNDPLFLSRWKKAPVDFEICDTMKKWAQQPTLYTQKKVEQTFTTALTLHASLLNLKSSLIPEKYQPLLNTFLKKIGYRFIINKIILDSHFTPNSLITITSFWKNIGVAPSYNNYPIVWRIVNNNHKVIAYFNTKNNITTWLPATTLNSAPPVYTQTNTFTLPKNIKSGKYTLEVGLVKPNTHNAVISLSITNKSYKKWYSLMNFIIQ